MGVPSTCMPMQCYDNDVWSSTRSCMYSEPERPGFKTLLWKSSDKSILLRIRNSVGTTRDFGLTLCYLVHKLGFFWRLITFCTRSYLDTQTSSSGTFNCILSVQSPKISQVSRAEGRMSEVNCCRLLSEDVRSMCCHTNLNSLQAIHV